MRYFLAAILLVMSCRSYSAQDFGTISHLYVDVSGVMAIQLKEGFQNSISLCTASNGWAYIPATAPAELKSLLLAAEAAKSRRQVTINECANGSALQLYAATKLNTD